MQKHKTILMIVIIAAASSIGVVYAVGGTNIIFKTSDGITSHEVMRITSDQKVGIGTTTPASTLDVNGTVGTNGIVVGGTVQKGIWNSGIPISNTDTTVDTTGEYGSIAIGTDGLPVVSYQDDTHASLKILHCGNILCTTSNTVTTVDTGNVGKYTSIAIGTDGLPVVSYFNGTNLGTLKVLHCGNVVCTSGNTVTTADNSSIGVGEFSSIAIGTDGLPVVSYWDDTNGFLHVLHCSNIFCNPPNTTTAVDSSGNVGQYTSIAIGADGLPVVSYSNSNLKVAHCSNIFCNSTNTITTVDSSGNIFGAYTSIAIGTDGLPVVSYQNTTSTPSLKILHCGNTACTSGNTLTTVDSSSSDVGGFSSIAIGTDGLPVVSYQDVSNRDLKMLHCGNLVCNSGNTITTVDPNFNTGRYTMIAIGTDGLPVIGYEDFGHETLKILHAGSILGISDWTRR